MESLFCDLARLNVTCFLIFLDFLRDNIDVSRSTMIGVPMLVVVVTVESSDTDTFLLPMTGFVTRFGG